MKTRKPRDKHGMFLDKTLKRAWWERAVKKARMSYDDEMLKIREWMRKEFGA